MKTPSTVDRLPEEIRAEIGALRQQGLTIDEILTHLRHLGAVQISRSALGRHVKSMEVVGEKLRRSRMLSEAWAKGLGDAPESAAARMNIELIHSLMLDMMLGAGDSDTGSDDAGSEASARAALLNNPMAAMLMAKAMDHLTKASRQDVEFIKSVETRAEQKALRQAAKAVDSVAREKGLSGETIKAIKEKIFGVRQEKAA